MSFSFKPYINNWISEFKYYTKIIHTINDETMQKELIEKAEDQIYELRKTVRYDIRELTIEIIVTKYEKGLEFDDDAKESDIEFLNTIYVPEYQRDFTWDQIRQSRFIESVLLGLPIPLVFVAENRNSAWEIVDGSQRIRTLHAFLNNDLILRGLQKIDTLNDFKFEDLERSRQGKLMDTPMRMIVLSEDADEEAKKDMFDRINRGSDLLKPMEKRKGIYLGHFRDFIYNRCAKNTIFKELAPIDKWLANRQEREELVLRFFAFSDNYKNYPKDRGVTNFLDDYLDKKNKELEKLTTEEVSLRLEVYYESFVKMLKFVKKHSKYGLRRTHNPQTKRVVFEAISVGVNQALKSKPNLTLPEGRFNEILDSPKFIRLTAGNVGNKKAYAAQEIKSRINYIAEEILA